MSKKSLFAAAVVSMFVGLQAFALPINFNFSTAFEGWDASASGRNNDDGSVTGSIDLSANLPIGTFLMPRSIDLNLQPSWGNPQQLFGSLNMYGEVLDLTTMPTYNHFANLHMNSRRYGIDGYMSVRADDDYAFADAFFTLEPSTASNPPKDALRSATIRQMDFWVNELEDTYDGSWDFSLSTYFYIDLVGITANDLRMSYSLPVTNPEPATLVLLALATPILMRRRNHW